MSLDDLGSSAWADAASPGNSPKLSDRDIWGVLKQPQQRTSVDEEDRHDRHEVPVEGETPIEEKDPWTQMDSGNARIKGESNMDSETDLSETTETLKLQETDDKLEQTEEQKMRNEIIPDTGSPAEIALEPIPDTHPAPATISEPAFDEEDDDGFGDFDSPQPFASTSTPAVPVDGSTAPPPPADDDFGDFGDFEDFDAQPEAGTSEVPSAFGVSTSNGMAGGFTEEPEESVWEDPNRPPPLKSLNLDPFPPADLTEQISTLLDAIFPARVDPTQTSHFTREPIRQVDGIQQILSTESSRELYAQLITPPELKPLDWKRSRVRREQLISLGVPVNLDEVDTTRLPPLKIVTKEGEAKAAAARNGRGTKERQRTKDERKLGEPPKFDRERAERLLSYREDQLSLVPAAYLTRMQQDLVAACSSASALVAHLKQIQEVRKDDNKQKNDQIAGLIAQAQRIKAGESIGGGNSGDPFAQDYPDSVDAAIDSTAQRCRFNKTRGTWAGHLLASGCSDGLVEVVDLDTKDIIRSYDGHVKAVESLSWSRHGRYLLSASKDWKCVVWDLFYTDQNMPPPPRRSSTKPQNGSLKRKRTRSTPEPQVAMQDHGSTSHIESVDRTLDYPTTSMRDSVLFDTSLVTAEFHPQTSRIILATTSAHEVSVVYLPPSETVQSQKADMRVNGNVSAKSSERRRICWLRDQTREEAQAQQQESRRASGPQPMEQDPASSHADESMPPPVNNPDVTDTETDSQPTEAPGLASDASRSFTFATFHPSGEWIYAGTSQGNLLIFDARTRWLVNRTKISTTALKQISFDRSGKYLVINSTDRAVRVMFVDHQEPPAPESTSLETSDTIDPSAELTLNLRRAEVSIIPLHKFQDQVSRTPWNAVGFSGDAEYVMGGAATKVSHNIYIWDRATGTLVKVLEGPKDSLDDCDWHPSKPIISSVTSAGTVNIWQTAVIENWSSFAPGFEELEENREYEEREDEFDIEDEEELNRRKRAEEEQHVQVLQPEKKAFGSHQRKQAEEAEPETDTASFAAAAAEYWQSLWPDDDDDVSFFPHIDLESVEVAEAEEDATRL